MYFFIYFLVMAGCAIFITYNISIVYNNSSFEMYHLNSEFHCVHSNETSICLENCGILSDGNQEECSNNDICISTDQMCNGILELFNLNHYKTPFSCKDRPYRLAHFFDELFCRENWIGIYVTIFATGAISIICCVAIWILSLSTILGVFKCFRNAIRHTFCAQIPLINQ